MTTTQTIARWMAIVADHYDITGSVTPLPGYVDTNLRIDTRDGSTFVVRITHPPVDITRLDFIASVLASCSTTSFATPTIVPTRGGTHHVTLEDGVVLTVLTWIEGMTYEDAGTPGLAARSIGNITGEMVRTLAGTHRGVSAPDTTWDLVHAEATITSFFGSLGTDHQRHLVRAVLDRFLTIDTASLPRQVVHNDINPGNMIVSGDRITGLLDFGDATWTFRISELAIACAYAALDTEDPVAVISEICAGYRDHVVGTDVEPTPAESDALGILILTRLATSATIAAARSSENPHWHTTRAPSWNLLNRLVSGDLDAICAAIAAAAAGRPRPERTLTPRPMIGTALSTAYDSPIEIMSGEGVHLHDAMGRRYLDCVNNVCHVGHAHPRVVEAATISAATLNTNTRYLHPELPRFAARLIDTLPDHLDTAFVVNSGSEANELAIRLARAATGRTDVICIDDGYHGNTSTLIDVSPYKFNGQGGRGQPSWVTVFPSLDPSRDPSPTTAREHDTYRERAVAALGSSTPSALIIEALPGCAGQVVPTPGSIKAAYDTAHEAGAVVIADEVQTGLGRVGSHFWAFELYGLQPDIVTIGKPLGNGHPVAAVITTRAIAQAFDNGMEYFNTFGGNPVSAAVGNAVLDVIEDERLQERARAVGSHVMTSLSALSDQHHAINDVRGVGLFIGVEITDAEGVPAAELAHRIVQRARHSGVLLSTDGPGHNVLKIKPPLVFSQANADQLVATLQRALA